MCRELEALRESISGFAASFDASVLTPAQAGVVVGVCARLEASIASVKALAVARYARGEAWKAEGFRSVSDQLAVQTGMSVSRARQVVETGQRLSWQPSVAAAALAGELSADQAAVVSEGVAADPAKAAELLETARGSSLGELHEQVARVKAGSCDQDQRRRARHAKRSFRSWTDTDGGFHARLYGHPEDGAALWQAIDPIRRRLIMARRQAGQANEALEALDYDAVMALAGAATGHERHLDSSELAELGLFPDFDPPPAAPPAPTGAGPTKRTEPDLLSLTDPQAPVTPSTPAGPPATADPPPGKKRRKKLAGSPYQVIIRIDYDALLRGVTLGQEICEISGYGPIPVAQAAEILAANNPLITAVLTSSEQVLGVRHFRRRANAVQKTALNWLYPSCAARGCNARLGLQTDHRDDWARTHYTLLDSLDRLCSHHHDLKTRNNWALIEGTGKRHFVPPTDPRHPKHRTKPPPAGERDSRPQTAAG